MIYNKGDILIYIPDGDHALIQTVNIDLVRVLWIEIDDYWDYTHNNLPPDEYLQVYTNIFGVGE